MNPREVLARVVEFPIATWNYRAQSDSIRHMGPMAQDFFAAFEPAPCISAHIRPRILRRDPFGPPILGARPSRP